MRTALLLLFLSAAIAAGEGVRGQDEEAAVRALVSRLGSNDYLAKLDARAQLLRMGPGIHPLLDSLQPTDPEVARLLRGLTRTSKVLRLVVTQAPKSIHLGSHLTLDAELVNDSPHAYWIRFAKSGEAAGEDAVALSLSFGVEGGGSVVAPHAAIGTHGTPAGNARWLSLPGSKMRFKVFLFGDAAPTRKGALTRMRLVLEGGALRLLDDPRQGQRMAKLEQIDRAQEHLVVAAAEREVKWVARSLKELDALLRGDDKDGWRSAHQELQVRDATEVLALLRAHAQNPEIRETAIRRLGALALEQDLDLIRAATLDKKRATQLAAIEALGRYRNAKARRRLLRHVYDYELRDATLRALTHHKHPATVSCFLHLLKTNVREGAWVRLVQDCLEEWTGLRIENRPSEIRSFERWWIKNQEQWTRENVSGS